MLQPDAVHALDALLARGASSADLTPFVQEDVGADLPELPAGYGSTYLSGFGDPLWKIWKLARGVAWDRAGEFRGRPVALEVRGERDYVFRQRTQDPFCFVRQNGQVIQPPSMATDDGSIPRIVWAVPGLDPWSYTDSFLIHDALYVEHHCRPELGWQFAEANDVLAEAVCTMMVTGLVAENWRALVLIHAAVSSFVGRRVWDRGWDAAACDRVLNV